MADEMVDFLKASLQFSGSGYAAVTDGVMDVRTVSDTAQGAAVNALMWAGYAFQAAFGGCDDESCDCKVRFLAQVCPATLIVPVKVEAAT